jgi:sulfonate transport system substrate-binding protein
MEATVASTLVLPSTLSLQRRSLLLAAPALMLAARARAATATLRVGDQKGGIHSLMQAAGALDGAPYSIEWSQFPAAAPVLEALNAGAIDVGVAGDAPSTFAIAAGLRGHVISVIRTTSVGTAIVVPKNSPIHTAADLKGRTIAGNRGSYAQAIILGVAEQQGWKPGDYTMANLLPAEAKTALAAGAVDAWASWGVYIAQARLVDDARVVIDGSNGLMAGLSFIVASDTAIAKQHDALQDFARRHAAARQWALAHPDAYAAALAAEIGVTQPVARLTFDMDKPHVVPIDAAVIADEQRTADRFRRAHVIHDLFDAAKAFDLTFPIPAAG